MVRRRQQRSYRGTWPVLDHTLKSLDNGWEKEPAVRLAIHDAGPEPVAVVHEENWPPEDLQWRDADTRCDPESSLKNQLECGIGVLRH